MKGRSIQAALTAGAVLVLAGCSHPPLPPAASAAQTSAGITATLSTTPTPPHTGDDVLVITLTDAQTAQPIGDANVSASAEAQAPRLPATAVSGRAQGNGVYDVPVVLGIATSYRIQVQAQRPGYPTATFSFPIDVPR